MRTPETAVALTDSYARQPEEFAAGERLGPPAGEQDAPWWEYYESPELNALVATALADNPNLNQVRARLEQAAATARRSLADLLPEVTVSGERETTNGTTDAPSTFSLRGAASYEIDMWGGNRAGYRSSVLQAEASVEDIRTAVMTLSASIVENWIRLLALREEEALLREQLKTNDMMLDLQHRRYEHGAAEALDVLQQKGALERTRALLPDVQVQQELVLHQLALLAGQTPSRPPQLSGGRLPEVLPLPDTGIPARLLQDRPDIRAAWKRLVAADWATEAARIERLPNFNISAAFSTTSAAFEGLFNTWLLNLAAGIAMPLIDGGARAAEQARQAALADERFHAYRETVLEAIGEVEGALAQNYHQIRKISALEEQLTVARNALEQAQISYANGEAGYISVLNELINLQSFEQQLVRERRNLALFRVALYRAIGLRGWTDAAIGEGTSG